MGLQQRFSPPVRDVGEEVHQVGNDCRDVSDHFLKEFSNNFCATSLLHVGRESAGNVKIPNSSLDVSSEVVWGCVHLNFNVTAP